MAYRYGHREQMELFPQTIEDYVDPDDPVRAYDAFVEALDLDELGITLDEKQIGNPEYHPKAMLKLLTFGYSYGIRSSRKLERAVYHNLAFIWLMGGLKPDHKTIAEFRRNNKTSLKEILKECARLCISLDLIEGNALFVDGTKIRANASIKNTWTKERSQEALQKIDQRIEEILSECEAADENEQDEPSLVSMQEELHDKSALKTKIQEILKELNEAKKNSINTTDKECGRMNSLEGSHAGYNIQAVVDEKHGLIVNTDVVNENNDRQQFAAQISQANETLGQKCSVACADQGYSTTDELEKVDKQDIKVVVPPCEKSDIKKSFIYDPENDYYLCPEGHILENSGLTSDKKSHIYRIKNKSFCLGCSRFNTCTKSKHGKTVCRLLNEEARQRFEDQYNEPESQEIYKLRQQKAELPFGHIKRNLGVNSFLLRGLDGAKAEISLLASCFNISRMITIFGIQGLIKAITA
ncbi:MAG: transposase [Candidatus Omnitrophica bacterium CG_4_9_14_0_2_um_filter_42_8]|nr:MAG: transposase [Candidatus Omnitrophica bacterium CG_4_9_14_0_2_um_filter_42_8]